MEPIKCKCVECTISRVMDVEFKRDLQHLVLSLCRILFSNIQEKRPYKNSQSMIQKMYHGDISCIADLRPFSKIFKTANYIHFEMITFNYSSSKIIFNYQWDLKEQERNLFHLIEISRIYYQSFLSFFYKIDRWRRLSLKSLTDSMILSRIEQFLPGFKYLYDFHWITNSNNNNISSENSPDSPNFSFNFFSAGGRSLSEPGVFFLASDYGVCVVVVIKKYYEDLMHRSSRDFKDYNGYIDYIDLVNNYKKYATERHENKLITVIGATFTEDPNCVYPFEFVDEIDRSIAKAVQSYAASTSSLSIYQAPRQEPARTYESMYGQSWDQQPQRGPAQLMKMPLNPGKSAPIVGVDCAYYHQTNGFEENNYFNVYNNCDYDYYYQNYN